MDKESIIYDTATISDIPELVRLRILYMIDDFGSLANEERVLGSVTFTYSLKVNTILVLWRGTLTEPGKGNIFLITGGMVSLSPPVGGVVVLAQPWEKVTLMSTMATGIRGKYFERNFLISLFSLPSGRPECSPVSL